MGSVVVIFYHTQGMIGWLITSYFNATADATALEQSFRRRTGSDYSLVICYFT